jgi:hypothetical protein
MYLANLTTCDFITGPVNDSWEWEEFGPRTNYYFSEVILSRICWTTYWYCSTRRLHRGTWAGHRSDTVPLNAINGNRS